MRKLLLIFCIGFIGILISISVFSKVNTTSRQIKNHTYHKYLKDYEITIQDNIIHVKKVSDETKKGIVIFATWPWLPLEQFQKYKEYVFLYGTSYETEDILKQ